MHKKERERIAKFCFDEMKMQGHLTPQLPLCVLKEQKQKLTELRKERNEKETKTMVAIYAKLEAGEGEKDTVWNTVAKNEEKVQKEI